MHFAQTPVKTAGSVSPDSGKQAGTKDGLGKLGAILTWWWVTVMYAIAALPEDIPENGWDFPLIINLLLLWKKLCFPGGSSVRSWRQSEEELLSQDGSQGLDRVGDGQCYSLGRNEDIFRRHLCLSTELSHC